MLSSLIAERRARGVESRDDGGSRASARASTPDPPGVWGAAMRDLFMEDQQAAPNGSTTPHGIRLMAESSISIEGLLSSKLLHLQRGEVGLESEDDGEVALESEDDGAVEQQSRLEPSLVCQFTPLDLGALVPPPLAMYPRSRENKQLAEQQGKEPRSRDNKQLAEQQGGERVDLHPKSVRPGSIGSHGHPYSCASPCPYVKRKGGCRAGTECTKCHLCFWTRQGMQAPQTAMPPRRQLCAAAEPCGTTGSGAPSSDTHVVISMGSIGHPNSCAPACKYSSKRGCKDGALCSRCHLCGWRRGPAQAVTVPRFAKLEF